MNLYQIHQELQKIAADMNTNNPKLSKLSDTLLEQTKNIQTLQDKLYTLMHTMRDMHVTLKNFSDIANTETPDEKDYDLTDPWGKAQYEEAMRDAHIPYYESTVEIINNYMLLLTKKMKEIKPYTNMLADKIPQTFDVIKSEMKKYKV